MIDLFRYVVAIDRFRNFHKAAAALGVTQPTLSRQLQGFEKELGVALFNRTKGLEPTEYGALVLERADKILSDVDSVRRTIDQTRGMEIGKLSIAVGPLPAQTWISDAVARMVCRYPNLKIRMIQTDWWSLTSTLHNHEAEIAVGTTDGLERDVEIAVEQLPRREPMYCCRRGHPLTELNKVSMQDVCQYPLAGPKIKSSMIPSYPADNKFGELSSDFRDFVPCICTPDLQSALRIVVRTNAIGLSTPEIVEREYGDRSIVILSPEETFPPVNYGIMRLRGRTLSPAAEAFRASAVKAERDYFAL